MGGKTLVLTTVLVQYDDVLVQYKYVRVLSRVSRARVSASSLITRRPPVLKLIQVRSVLRSILVRVLCLYAVRFFLY